MKIFLKFRVTLGFCLFLLAVLWALKDIEDWKEAAEPWKRYISMVDQNTALWVFAIAALVYIFWIDARPFVRQWRERKKSAIYVYDRLDWKSLPVQLDVSLTPFPVYANDCYVLVGNGDRSGKTLRNVKVSIGATKRHYSPANESDEISVDIQHGISARFWVGRLLSFKQLGASDNNMKLTESDIAHIENLRNGWCEFRLMDSHIGVASREDQTFPYITCVVSADDCPAVFRRIPVDYLNLDMPVTIAEFT